MTVLGHVNLQSALSFSSAAHAEDLVKPHHPITCRTNLRLEPDGALCCDHAAAPPDDHRTQHCIDHSIALLLVELGAAR